MSLLRFGLGLLALLLGVPLAAHPAPFSYLDLHLREGRIDGTLVVHVIDVAHDLGMKPPRSAQPAEVAARASAIEALVGPRLTLRTDRRLVPAWQGVTALSAAAQLRLDFRVPLERRPGSLTVGTALFPYDPNHQTFVNVYEGDTLRRQWIFGRGSLPRTFYAGTTAGVAAVVGTFLPAGIHHILIGPDHLLFLVGLLLLGGTWRALVRIVTAFTLGHSITLSLAALEIVAPPARLTEPAIALTIVLVGVDNLFRLKEGGRDLRAWAALLFGLVHGFGFASVLREFGLPREALGWSLASFNVGVEIGQLLVVVPVAGGLALLRRARPRWGDRVALCGSVVVIAAGAWWFVQRIIFPEGA